MDGSGALYVELLGQIEALLPSMADEIRREVDRGGREIELYEPPEARIFDDGVIGGANGHDDAYRQAGPLQPPTPEIGFEVRPSEYRDGHPASQRSSESDSDVVRRLSGDQRLAILVDAVTVLLRTVNGSERELTNFLRQHGVRSATCGAVVAQSPRVLIEEVELSTDRRGEVAAVLGSALADLRNPQ